MADTATRDYIWQRQYAAYPEESYEEGLRRVAKYVADGDEEAQRRFENILLSNRFLPGGRTLQGAASYHGNLTNCFVLDGQPASSLRERVMNLAKEMALISKVGGGVGANLDFLPGAKKEGVNPVTLLFHVHTPDTPEGDKLIRGEYLDLTTGVASSHEYPSFVQVVSADSDIPFKELPWILPEDSIEGIWDAASRMVDVLMEGKPVGVDLRKLRPEGAPVKGSGGTSSGPVSFAVEIFSNFARWAQLGAETAGPVAALRYVLAPTLRVIRQAGVRRGAGMATLSITHPDIRDWLSAKDLDREEAEGAIGTFNMSVLVPDGIMGNPTRGEKELLEEIAAHAWATGEPGIMFQDTINKSVPYHLKAKYGLVNATNPCVTGDTQVLTLAGPRSFKRLVAEGKDVDVWAVNLETNQPVIRTMRNPRVTRKDAELVLVEFDSGLKVRCTPDHNFFTTQRNKVMAKDLQPGQSVSAFHIHQNQNGHLRILRNQKPDHQAKQWFVHRLVGEHYGMDIDGMVVHHINGDPTDNRVENLTPMTEYDHQSLHYPERLAKGFYHGTPPRGRELNHKVVSVTPLDYTEDVYNGTVDEHHNYVIVDPEPNGKSFVSGVLSANCGEVPMYPYEECCLGAINLAEHVDEDGSVDASKLIKTTWAAVEFLDKVLDVSRAPLDKILRMRYRRRRIGLGIMGLADALIKMGLKYDAPEGRTAAADMMRTIAYSAHGQSCILGKEKGFPEEVETLGRRNIALLTVAPTGTTSMLAGVAGGVEPIFSKTISRRVGNDYIQIENPLASYPAFITAHEVAPADHVLMQAAVQNAMLGDNPTIANAISKTINLPHDATVAQVEAAYRLAWLSGCKSVTVYRDGSRANQILTVKEDEDSVTEPEYRDMHQLEVLGASGAPTREPTVEGRTYKYDVGNRKVYVTVNHNRANQLVEVFINLSRPSDQEAVAADIVGRLISLALKKGVSSSDILKHLVGFTDKTGGFVPEKGFVGSLWEAVAFALEEAAGVTAKRYEPPLGGDVCPNCGSLMERQEGCLTCLTCGYSQCS